MTCLIVEFEHLAQSSSQPDLLSSAGVSQVPLPRALPHPLGAVDEDQSPLLDAPVASVCPRKRSSLCAAAASAEDLNRASSDRDHQLPTAEETSTASKRVRLEDALTAAAAVPPPSAVNDTR